MYIVHVWLAGWVNFFILSPTTLLRFCHSHYLSGKSIFFVVRHANKYIGEWWTSYSHRVRSGKFKKMTRQIAIVRKMLLLTDFKCWNVTILQNFAHMHTLLCCYYCYWWGCLIIFSFRGPDMFTMFMWALDGGKYDDHFWRHCKLRMKVFSIQTASDGRWNVMKRTVFFFLCIEQCP